jgi:ribonucleoside-diphosphate reductase alpha chain
MFKQNISFETWGGEAGKYRLLDHNNEAVDKTPEDTCKRVALALVQSENETIKDEWYKKFLSIMGTKFAGGGRIMANAGAGKFKKETSPINCTVMRQIPDSLDGIMQVAKEAALTLKSGCGVGYDFSTIRPKGAYVSGAGAATSGIISFMKIFDAICGTIMSGGGRRGAQMACLDVSSPEIEAFITEKRKDGCLRYFNCSVLITDSFMEAVENDQEWYLWFWTKDYTNKKIAQSKIKIIKKNDIPYNHSEYDYFSFAEDHNEIIFGNSKSTDIFIKNIYKKIKARQIFDLIMRSTYDFAEPGFILVDRVNIENNLYFCEVIRATNPCVSGDTRLATNYGLMTAKELYDKQLPIMATVDNRAFGNEFGTTIRKAKPVFLTSKLADIYKISTSHGYEIKTTEWHELYTQRGKLKLKDIKVGDTLYIQSGKGQFGSKGSYELGAILGWITGDGHFSNDGKGISAYLTYWNDDKELASEMVNWINDIISKRSHKGNKNRAYRTNIVELNSRNSCRIKSRILADHLNNEYLFNGETKLKVPEVVWQGTEDCVKGYLQYLFQADGTFNHTEKNKHCRIVLCSSYPDFLKDIQKLLINFGIVSKIQLRRKAGTNNMPDGKGGYKEYHCKEKYELFISKENILLFMKNIGFITKNKNIKVNEWMNNHSFKKEMYSTTIINIEYAGTESVYDTTQKDKNAIICNGFHSGNCAEQPLAPMTSCLLGSMILPEYVSNSFEEDASFNFDALYNDVFIASRALDNVVEINNLPLKELQEQILLKRRHGLGFTGLGSVLNMLNMKYGSNESVDFTDKIAYTLAKASLIANIELAKEKGFAPIFASSEARCNVIKSKYLSRLINTFEEPEKINELIMQYGLRYSHATSIAPTGTMSLSWGNNCSNGIEPIFANSYMRNIRMSGKKTKIQEEVFDYAFFLWKEKYKNKSLPKHWSTTENLSVMDHLKIQAAAQKWCDSSISKTVNIPTDYSFEDFKKVYFEGWKIGLKGISTFRFNPTTFSGVLVEKKNLEKTFYSFTLEDGTETTLNGSETVEYDGETHNVANLFDALKEGLYGNM